MTRATVLILGGTREARDLAALLADAVLPRSAAAHHGGTPDPDGPGPPADGLRIVSSLAGRVRDPALPAGEVRIGGFGGADGLARWLRDERPAAVVDATHPFAETISASAAAACARTGTPLLSLVREPWAAGPGDRWHEAGSLPGAAALLPALGRRVFLTTGRQGLAAFASLDQWFLIRCVDPPDGPLPAASEVILARGPYDAAAERELMRRHEVDVLVTKNSGGALTEGKLAAARELGLPVVMVRRPPLPDVPRCHAVDDAARWALGHTSGLRA